MAEEPAPSTIPPSSADAANTAASAMNSISSDAEASSTTETNGKNNANLGEALSKLSVSDGASNGTSASANVEKKQKDDAKKVVKIDAADVAFLVSLVVFGTIWQRGLEGLIQVFQVEELEVSKAKATEMLKGSGGDKMAALKSFILPAVRA